MLNIMKVKPVLISALPVGQVVINPTSPLGPSVALTLKDPAGSGATTHFLDLTDSAALRLGQTKNLPHPYLRHGYFALEVDEGSPLPPGDDLDTGMAFFSPRDGVGGLVAGIERRYFITNDGIILDKEPDDAIGFTMWRGGVYFRESEELQWLAGYAPAD